MQYLPDALLPLAEYPQFILWKTINRNGKLIKLPIDHRTVSVGDAHDPSLWMPAEIALITSSLYGGEYGVGFVFTKNDPFFFVDIDKCLNSDNAWSDTALQVLGQLPGAAVEVSQSGQGLHIFGKGASPEHACKNIPLGLEFYTESRFVALTGTNAIGNAGLNCDHMLPSLVSNYFPPRTTVNPSTWTTEPREDWNGLVKDDALIKKMLGSKSAASAFGKRASFADLWNRNIEVLSDVYTPDSSDVGSFDESSADAGLAQHLAFWTGNNCERILTLMFMSGLVRDKWQREDYIKGTVLRAVSMQEMVYTGGKKKEQPRVSVESASQSSKPELMTGYQFLGATQQIEHFKGCVYIQDAHKVFTPSGALLKSDQFNATFGGYVFQLDNEASGKVTRKAWEAFTESQAVRYPIADTTCFRPELSQGELVNHEGRILVNVYVPIDTPRIKGDVSPFLTHLSKLLPNRRDRSILLGYMAACVQYKGSKFQWSPLIQGVEGNGKTLLTRCVEFAIGERYTHMPPASEIDEKFNDWLFNKLFIGIEDIYVPGHKQEVIEILKPMITNNRLAKRAMQQGQIMSDVCANFMINTNHKDGIRKTQNDRRFAMFFTAQQNKDDLHRDGMDGDYFPDLYDWLRADGYAIVADYLASYTIPVEFNPSVDNGGRAVNAPQTSSTNEAITASMGGVEQEILEAIDEGRPGFAGGWISSMAFEKLLQQLNLSRSIPHNKRKEMLIGLGYMWHPHLNKGRVNNAILTPDGGKPRLFIKDGHIHLNLTSVADISRCYQEAQGASFQTNVNKYKNN